MEGYLLILLALAFLGALGVAVVMLLDVTLLGGDRVVEERETLARLWRPPFVRGAKLLTWAREAGEELVAKALASKRGAATPSDVSSRLHDGAMRAMLPNLPDTAVRRVVPCPTGGQGTIGVTALEAIEIAEYIRWNLPEEEQSAILRQATEIGDARAFSGERPRDGDGPPACALQGEDCVCLTFGARPLRCRPLHATMVMQRLGLGRWDAWDDLAWTAHARVVAEGVEEGLVRALDMAGIDGNVYELNSAVGAALRTPEAARRWLDGEAVFADCQPAPSSALEH